MSVDLSPILGSLVSLASLGLMTLGAWAIQRFAAKLKIDANGALAHQLDDALDKSIAAGAMASTGLIKADGWDHADVKNAVVASGAVYLSKNWPDLLNNLGLDPANPETKTKILDLLTRAFPTAIAPVAASPATPSVLLVTPPPVLPMPDQASTAAVVGARTAF